MNHKVKNKLYIIKIIDIQLFKLLLRFFLFLNVIKVEIYRLYK